MDDVDDPTKPPANDSTAAPPAPDAPPPPATAPLAPPTAPGATPPEYPPTAGNPSDPKPPVGAPPNPPGPPTPSNADAAPKPPFPPAELPARPAETRHELRRTATRVASMIGTGLFILAEIVVIAYWQIAWSPGGAAIERMRDFFPLFLAWLLARPLVVIAMAPAAIAMVDHASADAHRFAVRKKEIENLKHIALRFPTFEPEQLDDFESRSSYVAAGIVVLTSLLLISAVATHPENPNWSRVCDTSMDEPCPSSTATGTVGASATPTPTATATPADASKARDGAAAPQPQDAGAAAPKAPEDRAGGATNDGDESERAAVATATPKPTPTDTSGTTRPRHVSEEARDARVGLLYASYGAFVLTLTLMVSRINSGAITARFLVNSSLRIAIAMVLGAVFGALGIFLTLATPTQALFGYFALGIFPAWALSALRKRAKGVMGGDEAGTETLPLSLVDGVDDGIADRLAEVGAWDVQHLATSSPIELAMRTLYPLQRIVNWMDQAILIQYTRDKIADFRALGIRGAMDFALISETFQSEEKKPNSDHVEDNDPDPKAGPDKNTDPNKPQPAHEVFRSLATKTGMSESTLRVIGWSLRGDTLVAYLRALWFPKGSCDVDELKRIVLDSAVAASFDVGRPFATVPATETVIPEATRTLLKEPTFLEKFRARVNEALRTKNLAWRTKDASLAGMTTWDSIVLLVMRDIQSP